MRRGKFEQLAEEGFHQREPANRKTPWSTYRLKFGGDPAGRAKEIEFKGEDASRALLIAHDEVKGRYAELWCDGRFLCRIKRTHGEMWEIQPGR